MNDLRPSLLASLVLVSSAFSQSDEAEPFARFAFERMDVDVIVAPDTVRAPGQLALEGELTLRLESERASELVLAMKNHTHFVSVRARGSDDVVLNERFEQRPGVGLARVHFAEPLEQGDVVKVSFVAENQQDANQLKVTPAITLASWVEAWYPVPMSLGQSLSSAASAVGETRFHLPEGWDVVSNGTLVRGDGVVTWRVDVPVARSFASARYEVERQRIGEREVGVYVLAGVPKPQGVGDQVRMLTAALAAQEARFGPYPYDSYAIAEVPEGSVGFYASSEQGFIMARSSAFTYEHGNLPLWAHEMAHGWWGNLVGTGGPGAILCSESLAQYSAVIAIETIEGREAATEFLRFSRVGYSPAQCARGYFGLWRVGTDKALSVLGSGGWQHTLSDAKGHWVYHMLRRRVGDELFFSTLRHLIEEYAGRELSIALLREAFIARAPKEAELATFFAQWLDRTGAPVIDLQWEASADGEITVALAQVQPGDSYHLRVDLTVVGESGRSVHPVELRERETRCVLSLDRQEGDVSEVLLDAEHALLLWHPDYGAQPD